MALSLPALPAMPALPPFLSGVNPHMLGGSILAVLTLGVFGSIALFGSVKPAVPVANLHIPSLAESSVVNVDLRGDTNGGHDRPLIEQSTTEPHLNGVTDLGHEPSAASATHNPAAADIARSASALPNVPMAGLTEPGPGGLLPIISADGTLPSTAYARPFDIKPGKPVVAVMLGGLGMMKRTTDAAIYDLPPEVTLSFVPYTPNLQNWVSKARAEGHEVLIELPMEPFGYPETDPGPYTLLSTASSAENTRRLEYLLSRTTGYFGVTNYMGSKLTASETALASVFRGLKNRGLDFLYDGATRRSSLTHVADKEGLHWSQADQIVDVRQTAPAIDDQLLRLEAMAIQNGSAIGKGFSWPVTIRQLEDWTGSLAAKGYQLAPVSAVIQFRNQDEAPIAETATRETAPAAQHAPAH